VHIAFQNAPVPLSATLTLTYSKSCDSVSPAYRTWLMRCGRRLQTIR